MGEKQDLQLIFPQMHTCTFRWPVQIGVTMKEFLLRLAFETMEDIENKWLPE